MSSPEQVSPASSITATTNESPIAQLLSTLGMTREDLERHTSQMRIFLDSENALKIAQLQAQAAAGAQYARSPHSSREHSPADSAGLEESLRPAMTLTTRPSHRETTQTPPPADVTDTRHSRSTSRAPLSLVRHAEGSDHSSERSAPRRVRMRERHQSHTASSPSARPKLSLDEVMQLRSQQTRRVSESEESEESGEESLRDVFTKRQVGVNTPRYRYPHPARNAQASVEGGRKHYKEDSPAISRQGSYYRDTSLPPVTPQANRIAQTISITPSQPLSTSPSKSMSYYRRPYASGSDLPPSSPVLMSSPISSPAIRPPYNLASSPGPMSDPPDQFDPDLPYTLPEGPYSEDKPEFSYAALIGQAILASPQHGLRLKDIYDYISIVYPFYKRNGHSHSQKWMNAIRQNLTNTPQFFKKEHPSGWQSKGALWCIAEENLPCFADGGYNRHALNPDSAQSQKAEKRKRKKEEKQKEEKTKRPRIIAPTTIQRQYTYPFGVQQMARPQFTIPSVAAQVHADIIFPPLPADHPNAHLVNTMPASSDSVDEDVIFPPLPAFSQTRIAQEQRLKELSRQSSSSSLVDAYSRNSSEPDLDDGRSSPVLAPPLSSESSIGSIPDLTPNNSSSSPRDQEEDVDEEDEFAIFSEYLESEMSETQSLHEDSAYEEQDEVVPKDKGKGKATENFVFPHLPPMPTSPTAARRSTQATRSPSTSLYAGNGFLGYSVNRSSTPPNDLSMYLNIGSTLTPLARRKPPSTPTRKRKVSGPVDDETLGSEERPSFLKAIPKTPSRRSDEPAAGAGTSNVPITPRRIFSPFTGFSPFRTPSRRNIFDAQDPSRILDDELEALAAAKQRASDSPGGLFPRGKGLLYESPNLPSPGKWRPW